MSLTPDELENLLDQLEQEGVVKRGGILGPSLMLTNCGREMVKRAQREKTA